MAEGGLVNGVSGRGATDGVGTEHRAVGGRGTGRGTWAERLGSSLPLGLNKNVLEFYYVYIALLR